MNRELTGYHGDLDTKADRRDQHEYRSVYTIDLVNPRDPGSVIQIKSISAWQSVLVLSRCEVNTTNGTFRTSTTPIPQLEHSEHMQAPSHPLLSFNHDIVLIIE